MYETSDFLEMPFLTGIVFLIVGTILYLFPPKKINWLYGYRTSRSMKNQEIWTFSQKYSSIKMIQSSFLLLLISCLGFFIFITKNVENFIGFISITIVIVFIFFSTEKALKTKFPNT